MGGLNLHCNNCGTVLVENAKHCSACGAAFNPPSSWRTSGGCVGYSEKINDPSFNRYVKNNNRWSAIISIILAVAAIMGFFIYGETSSEMENPQALYIGFVIGSMFLLIALFQIISRKWSKTWDGMVVDKTVKKKNRRQSSGDGSNDYYIHNYTEYVVIVQTDNGRKYRMTTEDDDTVFNYYNIGDRVRYHAGLNSYEKFDKSKDSIVFCNACGTLCDINDDVCFRCRCPLLK